MATRYDEIVAAARGILERDGRDGLTMRAVADAVGIRAPSLYKHLPNKAAIEAALAVAYLEELAAAADGDDLPALLRAYRDHALANPALYVLTTTQPLPRDRLPVDVEDRAAAALHRATGDPDRARAAWAFAHGMVVLELAGRFPDGADLDAAWAAGAAAFAR